MSGMFDKFTGTANRNAVSGLGKLLAVLIILAVTGMGDVMYIQLMNSKFPSGGPLLVFCYLGAFASFMAMGYLLIGKTISFRPGAQTIAAWCLLIIELVLASLNIMLVFSGTQNVTGFMLVWLTIAPITPILVMAGVLIVFFLDPALKQKHEDMEMEDRMNAMERQFRLLQHQAEMEIKFEGLKLTKGFLMEELQQADNVEVHRGIASQMYAQILSGFAGMHVAPRLHTSHRIVTGTAEKVSLAQTDEVKSIDTPAKKDGGKKAGN